jgi:hypothetical protein
MDLILAYADRGALQGYDADFDRTLSHTVAANFRRLRERRPMRCQDAIHELSVCILLSRCELVCALDRVENVGTVAAYSDILAATVSTFIADEWTKTETAATAAATAAAESIAARLPQSFPFELHIEMTMRRGGGCFVCEPLVIRSICAARDSIHTLHLGTDADSPVYSEFAALRLARGLIHENRALQMLVVPTSAMPNYRILIHEATKVNALRKAAEGTGRAMTPGRATQPPPLPSGIASSDDPLPPITILVA